MKPVISFSFIRVEKDGKSFEMQRLIQIITRKGHERKNVIQHWTEEAICRMEKKLHHGESTDFPIYKLGYPRVLPHAEVIVS